MNEYGGSNKGGGEREVGGRLGGMDGWRPRMDDGNLEMEWAGAKKGIPRVLATREPSSWREGCAIKLKWNLVPPFIQTEKSPTQTQRIRMILGAF